MSESRTPENFISAVFDEKNNFFRNYGNIAEFNEKNVEKQFCLVNF
jgi:hypothetical protein